MLVGTAVGEMRVWSDAEEGLVALCTALFDRYRLQPTDLIALRICYPDGSFPVAALRRLGITRIPVFWQEGSGLRVELHTRMRRKRRFRPVILPQEMVHP